MFVHAFGCFIRSEHEDKGMDCLPEFAAFQVCAAPLCDAMHSVLACCPRGDACSWHCGRVPWTQGG